MLIEQIKTVEDLYKWVDEMCEVYARNQVSGIISHYRRTEMKCYQDFRTVVKTLLSNMGKSTEPAPKPKWYAVRRETATGYQLLSDLYLGGVNWVPDNQWLACIKYPDKISAYRAIMDILCFEHNEEPCDMRIVEVPDNV